MTSSPERPKPRSVPDPTPMPLEFEEMEGAKAKVRGRQKGRPSTILAGRLMSQRGKTLLGE